MQVCCDHESIHRVGGLLGFLHSVSKQSESAFWKINVSEIIMILHFWMQKFSSNAVLFYVFLTVLVLCRKWSRISNDSACSKSNFAQSSTFKLTTCDLFLKKGIYSNSNLTALPLQMSMCKSLETISGMILNWLKPKFAAKTNCK